MRYAKPGPAIGVLLLFAPVCAAMPSVYALRGLYRVVDARTPPPNSYSLALITTYQYAGVSDTVRLSPSGHPDLDTLLDIYDSEHYLDATVLLNVGIFDYLEVGLSGTYRANAYLYDQEEPRGDFVGYMDGVHGFGEIMVSGKYSRLMLPWLTAGGVLWLSYPPGSNSADIAADHDGFWDRGDYRLQTRRPFVHSGGFSWGFLGLATAVQEPVEGHLNLGISGYNQSWDDPVMGRMSESDIAIDFGLGGSLPSRSVLAFMEYTARFFTGRGDQPGYTPPMRFVAGIRILQGSGAFFDLAGVVGLSGSHDRRASDPYVTGILPVPGGIDGEVGVVLTFGYDTSLQGAGAARGRVCGTVTSSDSGEPLDATISFPRHGGRTVRASDGYFDLPVESGPLVILIEAEGYLPVTRTVVVTDSGLMPLDFALEQAGAATGTVAGSVTDAATGSPLRAQVRITGLTDASGSTGSDGAFMLEVPEGTWTLQVTAAGYLETTSVTNVAAGQTSVVDFILREALTQGTVMSFANIYFDSGSANIKPSSYGVLDEIVDLLTVNSAVRVEVSGHTDSDGSESFNLSLSEQRATSVKNYLVQHGIASSRLTTIGRGESEPVASNDTPAGKAQNRRIEFTVL